MSIEFRLKYIREAIDKDVNDVLLKWNARKVLLSEPFDEERKELCPKCRTVGKESLLKYSYVNLDEAIYKCESPTCLYPFRNFKYKNFVDRTIFRYERIAETNDSKTDQKTFTSPTKIETDDIDEFNISWLGDVYTDDLDSIISAPSEGQNCDIKDIINDLCNEVEATTPATFNSPARNGTVCSPQSTAPKLSKCLQHIEHISPTKQTNSNQLKSKTPVRRPLTTFKSTAIRNIAPAVKTDLTSFKKARNSKNRQTRPVQSVVEQHPLGFLEWLNVVSKTEPKQIQELEFTTVNECKESSDLNTINTDLSTSNAETSTEANNVQPILIELIAAPEALGSDKLSTDTRPCLLYKLDHSKVEPTNDQMEAPVATQTFENLLTEDRAPPENMSSEDHVMTHDSSQDHIMPIESNVERSSFVSEDSQSTDSKIINTEWGTDINLCGQDHTATNIVPTMPTAKSKRQDKQKLKIEKEKLKLERMEKQKLERKRKRKLELQEKQKTAADLRRKNFGRKTFNIEVEENFLGFEAVEPFTPMPLRKKELIWLRLE
ncbi:uncharacterized protein LOC119072455 [Bradysia coprophila]|uniref:uncharacterized protein LOC119072455 n=1 Tax=Bradysia coprophila TaxID=38358 RepID=UPI00187D7DF0|nr:uncharacterized protein LOC119072455 [Bradysia coprophila]